MDTLLNSLYEKYNIHLLTFGAIHDKLGDVYEEYCVTVLSDPKYLHELKKGMINSLGHKVLYSILFCNKIKNIADITSISATNTIPHRNTGGNSKTDIIASVKMISGDTIILPISCKQSTVLKVALAEFDVSTICREMSITNHRLIYLLTKHQTDCSAKNFTPADKSELTQLMAPIRRDFVRWVLTGSPVSKLNDVCVPTSIIKFKLRPPEDRYSINICNGDFAFISFETLLIDECIDRIMYASSGNLKPGGFGTGLSWTYATGSKGQKMQFKG